MTVPVMEAGRARRPARAGEDAADMKKAVLIIVGVLVALAGVAFTLQGLNVMGNTAMSGKTIWAVLGPVIAIVGLIVAAAGLRQGRVASQ
jgi:uncharacterized RDD family membrane protein YckC